MQFPRFRLLSIAYLGLSAALAASCTETHVIVGPDAGDASTNVPGRDEGGTDAATDAGSDAATDAGSDASTDAGRDSGADSGPDAGPTAVPLPQRCTPPSGGVATPWIEITRARLTTDRGFDLDGIDNAAANQGGQGPTVAGCRVYDSRGGVDHSFESIAEDLATTGTLDLDAAFDGSLEANGGSLVLEFRLTNLVAPTSANASCVGAEIRVGRDDARIVRGAGSLVNHVASIAFDATLEFGVALTLPQDACLDEACDRDAELAIAILSPYGQLDLGGSNSSIGIGSLLGGHVFLVDENPAYAAMNSVGLRARLDEYADAAPLKPSTRNLFQGAFEGAVDLHAAPDGVLAWCSAVGSTGTDANAISITVSLDSF